MNDTKLAQDIADHRDKRYLIIENALSPEVVGDLLMEPNFPAPNGFCDGPLFFHSSSGVAGLYSKRR
jgi:hypothetical protein